MKRGWKTEKLGNVCEIYQPKTISKKQMKDDGRYTVFGANGIIGRYDKYNHEEPQVLITCRGATCGYVNISLPKSWITGNAMVVRPLSEEIDLQYLEYFCRGGIDYSAVISGAAQPQITRKSLSPVTITFPSLPEQKRIVAILDEAFSGIEKVVANTEKNLANIHEFFDSYLHSLYWKREEKWNKKKLGEVCENLDSKRVPITKSKRKPGKIPYYGASGVVDYVEDYLFDEDLLLVSEDGANLLARTYPIAFSISGKSWVNNHAHVLRFEDFESQKFIEYFLNSISLAPYVSGMAQPKLNQKALNSIPVPFPDIKTQHEVVEKLDEMSDRTKKICEIYEQKLTALTELKQSLLQKAFSGELTAEPQAQIKEAAA